jgi:hypothetical protein
MSMTTIQKKQWKQELMRDFPNCEEYFINLVLDLYEKNADYVRKLNKKKFKPIEQETPKEIVGAIEVVPGTEEVIKKYFQEPIYIPPNNEDTFKNDGEPTIINHEIVDGYIRETIKT